MNKLSVVLATRNEEANLRACLESVREIAGEIVVVDEYSDDKTRAIAKEYGAKVYLEPHHAIFHITKQKAIDKAGGDWILQLDADESVTPELAREIKEIINLPNDQIAKRRIPDRKKAGLFKRHQAILEKRDGPIGEKTGEIIAFFIPRRNYFLGKPLTYAGVYPDAVIRLFKKGKARLPAKSVHEQMQIDGEVGWLQNDLKHNDSPTLAKYFNRLNRYTDLHAKELAEKKIPQNIFYLLSYISYKPMKVFFSLYFRHLGFLDGVRGFLWSIFSAAHYPIAYYKYATGGYNKNNEANK